MSTLTSDQKESLTKAAAEYLHSLFSVRHRPVMQMEEFLSPLKGLGSEATDVMSAISNRIMKLSISREASESEARGTNAVNSLSEVVGIIKKMQNQSRIASARHLRNVLKNQDIVQSVTVEIVGIGKDVARLLLVINQSKERSSNKLSFLRECLHYVEALHDMYQSYASPTEVSEDNRFRFEEVLLRKRTALTESITVGVQSYVALNILQSRFYDLETQLDVARTVLIPSISNAITLYVSVAEGRAEKEELQSISVQTIDEAITERKEADAEELLKPVPVVKVESSSDDPPASEETSKSSWFYFKKKVTRNLPVPAENQTTRLNTSMTDERQHTNG